VFDALIVADGEITEYVPRQDRAAEVVAIVRLALDGEEDVPRPAASVPATGRAAKGVCIGGKGGV
jgi:hypothetical protein